MAHVTTPDEADDRMNAAGIYDALEALGLVEIATWLRECARAYPYITNDGGVDDIEHEVHMITMWHDAAEG